MVIIDQLRADLTPLPTVTIVHQVEIQGLVIGLNQAENHNLEERIILPTIEAIQTLLEIMDRVAAQENLHNRPINRNVTIPIAVLQTIEAVRQVGVIVLPAEVHLHREAAAEALVEEVQEDQDKNCTHEKIKVNRCSI